MKYVYTLYRTTDVTVMDLADASVACKDRLVEATSELQSLKYSYGKLKQELTKADKSSVLDN